MGLNGWHPGERAIRARVGLDKGPSVLAYTMIGEEMPEQHRVFYERNLAFLPLTTLDARSRPWASVALSADHPGERGFVKSRTETELLMRLTAPVGDPLIENLDRYNDEANEILIAGLGIELETRRRNKFAGKVDQVSEIGERSLLVHSRVNQAIGNCPKYINVREFIAVKDARPEILKNVQDLPPKDRLLDEAIKLILDSDTFLFGTSYKALSEDADMYPSHVGMNVRSGRPGFVRVLPSDGRTLVFPDYSGNRILTSLGNIEATPLAGVTVMNFETGDILYLSGTAKNLVGDAAQKIMPRQNVLTTLYVEAYTYVRNAVPFRQRPGSSVGRSPYSPPIKFLSEEIATSTSTLGGHEIWLTLTRIVQHSPTLATFSFETSEPVTARAGQAAALDFTTLLGGQEYSHMAAAGYESRLNDDRIRTWTISGVDPWLGSKSIAKDTIDKGDDELTAHTLHLTMREVKEGLVTGALFSLARRVALKMPEVLANTRPLGLRVRLSGISGSFCLPKEIDPDRSLKLLWFAGGIGLTPFLAILKDISSGAYRSCARVDIVLMLSTREPEVLLPLVYAAASNSANINPSAKMHITLQLFAGSHAELVEPPAPNDLVTITVVDRKQRFVDIERQRLSDLVEDVNERRAYMCGPQGFEEASMKALMLAGFDAAKVVRESFNY